MTERAKLKRRAIKSFLRGDDIFLSEYKLSRIAMTFLRRDIDERRIL